MNYRFVSGLVFAMVIIVELIIFTTAPKPTKTVVMGERKEGNLFPPAKIITDQEAQQSEYIKTGFIIGSTAIVGMLITFSLPKK